jgi:hypothetical protein
VVIVEGESQPHCTNDVLSKDKVAIPQLSVEALFISATTIEAAPAALS